jgi:Leucine-rich repeat (LRR) protein
LLVLMLVVCIGMSWLGVKMQQARKQREAVIAILAGGGRVQQWIQEFAPLPQGTAVPTQDSVVSTQPIPKALTIERALFGTPPSYAKESRAHAWLRRLLGDDFFTYPRAALVMDDVGMERLGALPRLRMLHIWGPHITDAGLSHLRHVPQLRELFISDAVITDAGLAHLKWLPHLQVMYADHIQITDTGIQSLKGLTQLNNLVLSGTQVTDAGLEHLKGLSQLHFLELQDTQVSDAGLSHLVGLSQLGELWLENTQVTDSGVKKLQQALPNCRISR